MKEMDSDGLEEGEIFEEAPVAKEQYPNTNTSTSSTKIDGFWVKMTKSRNDSRRSSYHYSISDKSPSKKSPQKHSTFDFLPTETSFTAHPLDPLGDFDSRLHLSDTAWGDVDERSQFYRRPLKMSRNSRTNENCNNNAKNEKRKEIIVVEKNSDVNAACDENFPKSNNPEQEDELTELQLRLEALRSTIEKSNVKKINAVSGRQQQQPLTIDVDETVYKKSTPSSDSARKNTWTNEKPKRKRTRPRNRRRRNYVAKQGNSQNSSDRPFVSLAEWNRLQREKILRLSDPNEQCRQFLNMVVTSRKDFENLTSADSSSFHTIVSKNSYSNTISSSYDPCTSSAYSSFKEDYTAKNMDIDSDSGDESKSTQEPTLSQVVTYQKDANFALSSVSNRLGNNKNINGDSGRNLPLSSSMQILDDRTKDVDEVAVPSLKPDCKDEEEIVILKCSNAADDVVDVDGKEMEVKEDDDSIEIIEENPEKIVELVTIEGEDVDDDDDEMTALRELLLHSMKKQKTKIEKETQRVTPMKQQQNELKQNYSSPQMAPSKEVYVMVGGNGRRNVEVGNSGGVRNLSNKIVNKTFSTTTVASSVFLKNSVDPATTSNKKSSTTTNNQQQSTYDAAHRLIVSTTLSPNCPRIVSTTSTSYQHRQPATNTTNRNHFYRAPFVDHKPVLIPLDDDDDSDVNLDEEASCSSEGIRTTTTIYEGENALNECLKTARQKADIAKQKEMKRKQNEAMVEMLEERLKCCRDDLSKHKDTLSEDRRRLRTLESTASKRKTDLRLAEMKLQKLKEELRNVEEECAAHRVFILRVNKEIQNVQSRVDRSLEMQIVYENQWKEIQDLVGRHRKIVERQKMKSFNESATLTNSALARRRRTSLTKAAAACLIKAKRKSSEAERMPRKIRKLDTAKIIDTILDVPVPQKIPIEDSNENLGEISNEIIAAAVSPLICFKSYRITKNFSELVGVSLATLTYCNKILPVVQFCPFALNGTCFDSTCKWQHECDFKLSEVESIADLLAFCPTMINGRTDGDSIIKCAEELYYKLKEKMTFEEILDQCALQIRQTTTDDENGVVILDARCWKPSQIAADFRYDEVFSNVKRSWSETTDSSATTISDLSDTNGVRYFVANYENELKSSPNDVDLWLRWANSTLNDLTTDFNERTLKTLNILSTALEKNRNDARLWLTYLNLFKNQSDAKEKLSKMIRRAVELVESFDLYWMLWDCCENFDENVECYRLLISFLSKSLGDRISERFFRVILRFVRVYATFDKLDEGKKYFQEILNDSTFVLSPCHKSLLWLLYIRLIFLDCLPAMMEFYVNNDVNVSTSIEMIERDFAVPWGQRRCSTSVSVLKENEYLNRIFSLFDNAFLSLTTTTDDVDEMALWILYKNRISLECQLGRYETATKLCNECLSICKSPFDDLLIVSRQCRIFSADSCRNSS